MKIWCKLEKNIRKIIMTFCFNNISWTVDMNTQMSELMISSPHNFPCNLYILIFFFLVVQTCKSMSPYRNILFYIYSEWIWGKFYFLIAEILYIFFHFCMWSNTWKIVRQWHHQLTHLHIHIDCSRNVSMKITEIQHFISSLFFYPI